MMRFAPWPESPSKIVWSTSTTVYQLVLVATARACQIANGKAPLVEEDNDKPTVLGRDDTDIGVASRSVLSHAISSPIIQTPKVLI